MAAVSELEQPFRVESNPGWVHRGAARSDAVLLLRPLPAGTLLARSVASPGTGGRGDALLRCGDEGTGGQTADTAFTHHDKSRQETETRAQPSSPSFSMRPQNPAALSWAWTPPASPMGCLPRLPLHEGTTCRPVTDPQVERGYKRL